MGVVKWVIFVLLSGLSSNLIEIEAQALSSALLDVGSSSFCISYNSDYQKLPETLASPSAVSRQLVDLSKTEGCSIQDLKPLPIPEKAIVAVMRGNCTFIQKATNIEAVNGGAALIVDFKNSSRATVPGGNASDFESINITLATITWNDYKQLLLLGKSVVVRLYAPPVPYWDTNMIVIVIFSTAFVMMGAGWAAYEESQSFKQAKHRVTVPVDSKTSTSSEPQEEQVEFTVCMVVIWFVFICAVIVFLYFFYEQMVYFFIAMFCLAGSYSLYQCLLPIWSHLVPLSYDIPVNRLPCIKTKVKLRSFLLYMPCLTLGIFWAIERHSKYAWTIQDLLGSSFCIFFIHNLRLPNLKVIGVLLILLLVYDVFFVFITPYFTKNGDSIMESVATGGSSHSKESLPMVFLVPILSNAPIIKCRERSYSLLGFGDVIIPGLLIAYNAIFDVKTGTRMVYFICSSVGYLFGMIICMISLIYMNSGQPALLYLVPCTLLTTIVVALMRKELRKLFLGSHYITAKALPSDETQVKDIQDADTNNDCLEEEQPLI
ncbi:unnamed protein product [Lymnaea stagnalis]|uniref:PA domain-containing protein n=1 Tax=Lymnaea stagnalis TaxID=6523 RepID=A0AAV2HDH9_LYMST